MDFTRHIFDAYRRLYNFLVFVLPEELATFLSDLKDIIIDGHIEDYDDDIDAVTFILPGSAYSYQSEETFSTPKYNIVLQQYKTSRSPQPHYNVNTRLPLYSSRHLLIH